MAKRRHFGSFCVALSYNFPTSMYRAIEPVALIAYSTKVHQYHDWLLRLDGTRILSNRRAKEDFKLVSEVCGYRSGDIMPRILEMP
uniref:LAGLIDADG endonuclease n=1 Tax=Peronospora matthiolae TaxID=2874970 RepID=A0AAV1TI29_9STRA